MENHSEETTTVLQKRVGEGKCYKILRVLSRIAVWSYFRHLKVICRTPIPTRGPVLVAANHTNMVLDPAMLIATFPHARSCHFWALARFFKIPVVGQLLLAGGVLPVDTKTHSNAKLFEHTLDCLGKGGVIAVFPEGTSYTAPNHLPFKDGLSWATFEYLTQQKANGFQGTPLPIIPVGITYTTKNKWRSDVVIEYGEPVVVGPNDLDDFQRDPKSAVKRLTERIAEGVENGTVNAPDWDTAHAASEARFILFGDTRGIRLEDYVKVSQSFIDLFRPDILEDNNEDNKIPLIKERKELKSQLILCSKNLKRMKLSALDIRRYEKNEITQTHAFFRLVSSVLALLLQLPLFLPGMIINSPLYLLGRYINHYEVYTESVAQDKVVSALTLSIPIYSILFYFWWRLMDYSLVGWMIGLLVVPLFAWHHIKLVDKRYDMAKEVVASWRIFMAVTGLDDERRELEQTVKLRRWCLARVKFLLLQLDRLGDPRAHFLVEYGQPLFQENSDDSSE
ncbi:uncharacterized protein BX664DRAFT_383116 [Halteromyces radiatus]|uniref:uncharacterized protein n=1 Tax=Halteromyces radiatus TaxID=101107 RepID=UPI00222010C0|nr:uncharacterized protein BX664DRAFT_383116 [Halteromyces radiatus]KAI8096711.1 hypothetical protein BX664DRAFT_383116 [Halteromyces radiatus]